MPVGSVTGLSSGIQWADTVDLMMQIERRPVDLLESRRATTQLKLSTWDSIQSKIQALQTAARELDSITEFLKKTGTSADTDVLTVTADGTAVTGTHQVIVNQLAAGAVHAHKTGWADLNSTAVNSSGSNKSFSYDYAGTTVTVTVPDGTTLQGLVNLINRDPNNPGVTASVVNDGSGGGSDYHLALSGDDTGAGNDVTIIDTGGNPTDIGPTGSEFDEANWDTTQAAQDSQIRVDGVPDPGWGVSWIESDSNVIDDVIPGVTLHLKDTSGGNPVEIQVNLDKATIETGVKNLINKFNDVISDINSATRYDTEQETAGPLTGDSLARSIRDQLLAMLASNIPGTTASDVYRSLGQAGVKMGSGGELSLDDETFEDALDEDALGVARLFAFDSISSSTYINVNSHSEDTVGGTYNWTVTYNASGELDPSGTNTIDGQAAVIHGTNVLEGAGGSNVEGLVLTFADPGDGPSSLSGTVQLYTGLAVLLNNAVADMVDPIDGTIISNKDALNDSIANFDDRIADWERRLDTVRESYEKKFQEMELLVGQMRTMGNYISSAF